MKQAQRIVLYLFLTVVILAIPTNLLFFQRDGSTEEIWYYDLPLPEGLKKFSKGSPIQDEHFDEARAPWAV